MNCSKPRNASILIWMQIRELITVKNLVSTMGSPRFDTQDLNFSLKFDWEKGVAKIDHFEINEDIRGHNYGSIAIETLKRVALQREGIEKIIISIGGGEKTEEFLKSNGFEITERRSYDNEYLDYVEGDYGVDAIYKQEWIADDYSPLE
jgi:hypothetical protein